MKGTRSIQILRCTQEGCKQAEDKVATESGLRIILVDSRGEVDFALIRTIMVDHESLITGLLFTSRVITTLSDILEIQIKGHRAKVTLADGCEFREKLESLIPTSRLILGICGPNEGIIGSWQACDMPPVESSLKLAPKTISQAIKGLNQAMPIFRATGGTHGAAIADQKGTLHVIAEDVGRHNAMDRVFGKALQKSIDFSESLLVSSGRLTSDLVLKAAVARLPIVASISAAVTSGIELAEAAGVTLVGFVRGLRMNIYTHPERILIRTN